MNILKKYKLKPNIYKIIFLNIVIYLPLIYIPDFLRVELMKIYILAVFIFSPLINTFFISESILYPYFKLKFNNKLFLFLNLIFLFVFLFFDFMFSHLIGAYEELTIELMIYIGIKVFFYSIYDNIRIKKLLIRLILYVFLLSSFLLYQQYSSGIFEYLLVLVFIFESYINILLILP